MSRLPVAVGLLLGAAADDLLGDPRRFHPVAGLGRAMLAVEDRLWRDDRRAGVVHVALGVAVGTVPVWLAERWLRHRPAARTAVTATVTWSALGGRSLAAAGREIGRRVAADDIVGARALAPTLVGRDPATLDADGLVRAGLESVAENTADAVVAPLLWGAALGAPGVALHRTLNTMDAMVGHRSERYERYGWAAARADDIAAWPAARAAALLTVVAAPSVRDRHRGGGAIRTWRVWRRDGRRHPSPNAGHVEAAFAGALGVRLGGRNVYAGRTEDRPRLGDAPDAVAPQATDLDRAATLSRRVGGLAAAVAATSALLAARPVTVLRRRPRRCRRPDRASFGRCGH